MLDHAHDLALDDTLDSGHMLLALFIDDNRAKAILEERGVEFPRLADVVRQLQKSDAEPLDTVAVVHHKTVQFAEAVGAELAGTLHLLAGMARVQRAVAFQALEACGIRPVELRSALMRTLSGTMPKQWSSPSAVPHADRVRPARPADARVAVLEAQAPEPPQRPLPKVEEQVIEVRKPPPPERPAPVVEEPRRAERDLNGLVVSPPPPARRPERKSRFALDPEIFPSLTRLGRNHTLLAERGEMDPLVGRASEVEQLVDILNKRRSNNPCLLGEPGVGKTALVEGLAQLIVRKDARVGALGEKVLVELDMGTLVAGTQLRGAFSERLRAVKEEVANSAGRIILFIDELHTLMGAGAGDGALDAANELKTALARGELPCIGSTTEREYRRHVEGDAALARRFQVVLIDEPSPEEALTVLVGVAPTYAKHHRVEYPAPALEAAVRLSGRWIFDRYLPSKAIDVLDLAGAHAARNGRAAVEVNDVARVVALKAGVPEARLLETEPRRLLKLGEHLKSRVIAHDEAMERVAAVIRRNAAGFVSHRPMGSFLLLGPTGVGKTECARVLAEFLFGSREALTRIDMSEHMDAHSVSRLIGAPPGFVGHEDGGQLTEAVRRRPYQIVVFDEVEKAAPEVLNLLLQLLEEGVLTDGRGRKVRFRNTVVLLTSNLGQAELDAKGRAVGFGAAEAAPDRVGRAMKAAERGFSPELWNRIEDKLVFSPLGQEAVRRIAHLLVEESAARIQRERQLTYTVTPAVIDLLVDRGFDARLGARPLRRVLQHLVENALADALLEDDLPPGAALRVDVVDGQVQVTVA